MTALEDKILFLKGESKMPANRILLYGTAGALILVAAWCTRSPGLFAANPAANAGAANQELLKVNEECNAAELKADIKAMDACETADFTHTHANGMVEHKAEYLQGVGSGAHHFLALDLSDVHVRTYGTTGIVEEHMHLRANNSGKIADVHNLVMTVWTKQNGKWLEAAWIAVGLPKNVAGTSGSN
jgi:hypothetical protein